MPSSFTNMNFVLLCLTLLDAWTDILMLRSLASNFIENDKKKIVESIEKNEVDFLAQEYFEYDLAKLGLYTDKMQEYYDDPVVTVSKSSMGEETLAALTDFRNWAKSAVAGGGLTKEDLLDNQMAAYTRIFKESANKASDEDLLDCEFFDLWDGLMKSLFQKFERQYGKCNYLEETKAKWFEKINYGYMELDGHIYCHVSPATFKFIRQ